MKFSERDKEAIVNAPDGQIVPVREKRYYVFKDGDWRASSKAEYDATEDKTRFATIDEPIIGNLHPSWVQPVDDVRPDAVIEKGKDQP